MLPNGSQTLPRGFRYEELKTPEPASSELRQPSPPRQRLKVRRRIASSLNAPTEQFMASVAAADLPVPTIDVAQREEDLEMPDRDELWIDTSVLIPPSAGPAPKTPNPLQAFEALQRRPDWSMPSSPAADYFLRPASALSNTSGFSDDSFYSGSRASRPSDHSSCTSPDSDISDLFSFPPPKHKAGAPKTPLREDTFRAPATTLNNKIRSKTRSDAPWSNDQSAHLWSTYMVYLQDPTVTPFRIGASAVPPEGVCHRVAREAKRSWKGPKNSSSGPVSRQPCRLMPTAMPVNNGSATPTSEPSKVYGAWPHSSAATRNHLRDMCRKKNNKAVSKYRHHQSPAPTPFTRAQLQPESSRFFAAIDPSSPVSFCTQDIALSLTTSTAESMQPDGPLAQLAAEPAYIRRPFVPLEEFKPLSFGNSRIAQSKLQGRRLASPFVAKTYGPSSSNMLEPFESYPEQSRTRSDTLRQLQSPLQLNEPYLLNEAQKRHAQCNPEVEFNPKDLANRPSILNEKLFGLPLNNSRRVRSRGFSLGDEAVRPRVPDFFQRSSSPDLYEGSSPPFKFPAFVKPVSMSLKPYEPAPAMEPGSLLPSPDFGGPLSAPLAVGSLGSPFSESGPSNTFPRRLFQDGSATSRRPPFATMHQSRHSIESFDFGSGTSLQSRLQTLDTKLKEIREREAAAKQQ